VENQIQMGADKSVRQSGSQIQIRWKVKRKTGENKVEIRVDLKLGMTDLGNDPETPVATQKSALEQPGN
jgi:hypothetical protein